jgi:hypothetical protein
VADFNTKLELISRRGNPVGAEEMIERIEAQLAGDPLVVVTPRRKGILMTKTDQPISTKPPGPGRGLVWALAAFVAVLAVAGIYLTTAGEGGQVAEPTPTTVAEPTPTTAAVAETMTDQETLEAGVDALYSGDAETAAELFDLSTADEPFTDEQVTAQAEYQGAIGGRLTLLNCGEPATSGDPFSCDVKYENTFTDAIGFVDPGESIEMMVMDGRIVQFPLTHEHGSLLESFVAFLGLERSGDGQEECNGLLPMSAECAAVQLENREAWADWFQSRADSVAVVQNALSTWFGGDCLTALSLSAGAPALCHFPGEPAESVPPGDRTLAPLVIQYESILGAQVSLENCDQGAVQIVCDVHYSNALNEAVGKPPAVINRSFYVTTTRGGRADDWFATDYPQDAELRESFQAFAESGELSSAYQAAGCATYFTPDCATLMMENLDDWAAWYQQNN